MPTPPDRDALVEFTRRLTTPVDVPALVARGVIEPRGHWWRRWYAVLEPTRLPAWAVCQIAAMRQGGEGLVHVRFTRRNAAAARLHAELTAGAAPAPAAAPVLPLPVGAPEGGAVVSAPAGIAAAR